MAQRTALFASFYADNFLLKHKYTLCMIASHIGLLQVKYNIHRYVNFAACPY